MDTINEYMKRYVKLGVMDKTLYDTIRPETEMAMQKVLDDICDKFTYTEIYKYIKRNFLISIN